MKNIVFWCFTPYHIKVANFLCDSKFKDANKYIILSSFSDVDEEVLMSFINISLYKEVKYINLNYTIKAIFSNPYKNIKKIRNEVIKFEEFNNYIQPSEVLIFSDEPIPYQKYLNSIRNKHIKITLVEEGTAIYLDETTYKFGVKKIVSFYIRKFIYGYDKARIFMHSRGEFEDCIIARRPELINIDRSVERVKLCDEEFKKINNVSNKFNIEIDGDNNYIFAPSCTIYNKKIMKKCFEDIFKKFSKENINLYVKLHPSEKYKGDIINLISRYNKNVFLLNDNSITTENLLSTSYFKGIISDTSSILVNAVYINKDIKTITYKNYLEYKYKYKFKFNIIILEKFIEDKIISEWDEKIKL